MIQVQKLTIFYNKNFIFLKFLKFTSPKVKNVQEAIKILPLHYFKILISFYKKKINLN